MLVKGTPGYEKSQKYVSDIGMNRNEPIAGSSFLRNWLYQVQSSVVKK